MNQSAPSSFYLVLFSVSHHIGQGKAETGACAGTIRLQPDPTAVYLHNALDHWQAHADSTAVTIQLLEYAENLFVICGSDADAVVADKKDRIPVLLFDADLDER